jgi:hypothetical protein
VDIQPDEDGMLHLVSPPFLRLGASQPGVTLEHRMSRRPPTQSAHSPIMGSRCCFFKQVGTFSPAESGPFYEPAAPLSAYLVYRNEFTVGECQMAQFMDRLTYDLAESPG